jgi:homoserine O-acetyltransferase
MSNDRITGGELHAVLDRVFETRDFALESGKNLPELKIIYNTYGVPAPDLSNVILLTHGYTSSHRMVEGLGPGMAEGSWSSLVGPGKAIDTDQYYVISSNMLGSSYGSTGPAHPNPATGRPYGPDFPDITLVDIVTAQRAMLEHLGVSHLVAVVGNSYGGFQAFQWGVTFPDFADGIVPVTTNIKGRGDNTANLVTRFEKDPNWNGGHYYETGGVVKTLTRLRIETLENYGYREYLATEYPDPDDRVAEIRRLAEKWATIFDANSLIVLGNAIARFNVEKELSRIKARVLFVLSRTDKLFPPSLEPGVMAALKGAGVRAEYFEIDSDYGHAAVGLDGAKWAPRLALFIQQVYGLFPG